MIFISLSIILFLVVLSGWGMLLLSFFNFKRNTKNPLVLFFVGYSFLIVIINYITFFKKLDEIVLAIVLFTGIMSPVYYSLKRAGEIKINISKISLSLIVGVSLIVLFEIVVSLSGKAFPAAGDTTGYHLGIVSWLNNYSLVPGIANLHFRLGNYSGYLQLASVIDNYKWDRQSPFIMPGLFFFSYFMYFIWEIVFVLFKKVDNAKLVIWSICYAVPILLVSTFYYFDTFNSSPNLYYDILPMFLAAIIVNEIMKYLLAKGREGGVILLQFIFVINILSMAAYLSKQNAALVVIMVGILSTYLLNWGKLLNLKNLLIVFSFPFLGFLGSVVSNLITSGYPLFPLPMIHFSFPWTASADSVNQAYDAVKYWAKLPGADYMRVADNNFLYWFIPWIKRNMLDSVFVSLVLYPFVGGLIIWIVNVIFCIKMRKKYYWLFIVVFLNLIYWFLLAPDIRFGILFFIIFFATGFAVFVLLMNEIYNNIFHSINKYSATVALLIIGFITIWSYDISKTGEIKGIVTPDKYFYINVVEKNEFFEKDMHAKSGNNITVYIPKDNECRSLPLPCTPYYSESVKSFDDKNLGKGFYYEKMQ